MLRFAAAAAAAARRAPRIRAGAAANRETRIERSVVE
jgi:hypothetical protein